MPIITTLYQVQKRAVSVVANPTTVTLAQAQTWDGQLYVVTTWATKTTVLDLTQIVSRVPNLNGAQTVEAYLAATLSDQFVASHQSTALPLPNREGRYSHRLEVYDPIGRAGFVVNVGDLAGNIADRFQLSRYDDLLITGPVDHDFTTSFVLVNGVLHDTVAVGPTLYVKHGYRNIRTKGACNIAIGDTRKLGGHTILPLTQTMLEASTDDPWLGVSLNLGDVNLADKTVLLVIDGYLHVLDGSYRLLSPNRLNLNVPRLELIKNFVHNPNVTFNPIARNAPPPCNPFLTTQPTLPNTPAPNLVPGTDDYAAEIAQFLINDYPTILASIDTLGITSPVALMNVATSTALLSQQIDIFFQTEYATIEADANSVAFLESGPAPGYATVMQEFFNTVYPSLLTDPSAPALGAVALLSLSPMTDDPAYVIQDVLTNTYPYVAEERNGRDVVLMSVGEVGSQNTELTNAMEQFFSRYYPDMNTPAELNPNNNVGITDLESLASFRISLQGKRGLDMTEAKTRSFLYDRLFGPTSRLIILPKAQIYLNHYHLQDTGTASRFGWAGPDTPRGLLKYDQRFFLPYTILAAQDFHFLVHIGLPSGYTDLIETAVDPVLWPAPHYDEFDARRSRDVEMLELFMA